MKAAVISKLKWIQVKQSLSSSNPDLKVSAKAVIRN